MRSGFCCYSAPIGDFEGRYGMSNGDGNLGNLSRIAEVRDVDALKASLGKFQGDILQVGRGPFSCRVQMMRTEDIGLVRGDLANSIAIRGEDMSDNFSFTPVTAGNQRAIWRNGQTASVGTMVARGPNTEYSNLIPKGSRVEMLSIRRERFNEAFRHLTGHEFIDGFNWSLVKDRAAAVNRFSAYISRCFDQQRARYVRRISGGVSLDRPAAEDDSRRLLDETLIRLVVDAINTSPLSGELKMGEHVVLLERAMSYMASVPLNDLTAERLCAEIQVSDRLLRRLFNQRFGLGPIAWARLNALHRVRDELKVSHPTNVTVAEVARRHGFRRAGAFSAEYKRQFGELPSHTLGSRGFPGVQNLTAQVEGSEYSPLLEF